MTFNSIFMQIVKATEEHKIGLMTRLYLQYFIVVGIKVRQ